jgi:hypothetical protein
MPCHQPDREIPSSLYSRPHVIDGHKNSVVEPYQNLGRMVRIY